MKRIISSLLIFLSLFTLTACKSNEGQNNNEDTQVFGADLQGEGGSGLYAKREMTLPETDIIIYYSAKYEQSIFLCGRRENSDETKTELFYKLDLNNEKISTIDYTTTELVASIGVSNRGNLDILTYKMIGESNNLEYTFREIDTDGRVVNEIDITSLTEGNSTAITGFVATDFGTFVCTLNKIVLIDDAGNIINTFNNHNSVKNVVRSNKGNILICGMEQDGYKIEELSSNLKNKNQYVLDSEYSDVFDGADSNDIFVTDNSNIYAVNYKTGERKTLVNLLANGVNPSSFIYISENRFFTIQDGIPTIWEPSEENINSVVTLKLATFDMTQSLAAAVVAFNSQNAKYKIDVVDYSMYNSGDNSLAGLTKLNTEIISGNLPDIFDLSQLPSGVYASRGVLEDLKPYIDSDTNFKYNDFVGSVMKTLSNDGHIYDFVPGFRIITMVGSSDVVGTKCGWTPEQFLDAVSKNRDIRPFSSDITRSNFIGYVLAFSGKDYINKNSLTCDFDNNNFSNLLEFASTLPDQLDNENTSQEYALIKNGDQLLSIVGTGSPIITNLIFNNIYNNKASFVGFPTNDGSGCAMAPYMRLGMSSICENKEGVWEFFRYLLSDEYQTQIYKSQSLPVLSDVLSKCLDSEIDYYQNNTLKVVTFYKNQEMKIDCGVPNDKTKSDVLGLINRIDCLYECDTSLYSIVIDEAQSYFAKQKSINEVLPLIQSRVQLYISEQYG